MKPHFLFVIGALFFTSCVSTSNLFQGGKTVGKNELDFSASFSLNMIPDYTYDTRHDTIEITTDRMITPWGQVQAQYGITNRWDAGGSIGVGIFSYGAQGSTKFALLPPKRKTGVSLFVLGGFSNSAESAENMTAEFYDILVALPVSLELSEHSRLVLQPMHSFERFKIAIQDEDKGSTLNSRRNYEAVKFGIGFIHHRKKHDDAIHYNLCLSYYEESKLVFPTFGVCFSKF